MRPVKEKRLKTLSRIDRAILRLNVYDFSHSFFSTGWYWLKEHRLSTFAVLIANQEATIPQ